MNEILVNEVLAIINKHGMLTFHELGRLAKISPDKAETCCRILKKARKVDIAKRIVHQDYRNCKCKVVLAK
jgi:hypothetical protein